MTNEKAWFWQRLALGVGTCLLVSMAYATVVAWHSDRARTVAVRDARARMSECVSARDDGYSPTDVLARCATAGDAARRAALQMQEHSLTATQLASSHLFLVRLFAPASPPHTNGLPERLAAFADDVGRVASWWPTADMRLSALAAYSPETDLRDLSASQEPREFVHRLYLTKSALGLIVQSLEIPDARTYGITVNGIVEARTLIDELIIATQQGPEDEADVLRTQYINSLTGLRNQAAENLARMRAFVNTNPWEKQAAQLADELPTD